MIPNLLRLLEVRSELESNYKFNCLWVFGFIFYFYCGLCNVCVPISDYLSLIFIHSYNDYDIIYYGSFFSSFMCTGDASANLLSNLCAVSTRASLICCPGQM